MTIVASGQLTLVDLNDSKQLVAYIGASQPKTVIYNPNTGSYTPDYSSSNNVLTPQLYVAGSSSDVSNQTTATRWYVQPNGTGTPTQITSSDSNYTLGSGTPKTLTIKNNVLASNNSMTYICEMDYLDPDTGLTVTAKTSIEIVKVTNGANGTNAVIGVLSNDTHAVPADANGNVLSYAGAVSTMSVFNGSTDDSANWTYSVTTTNVSGTASGSPANRTYTVTSLTADIGYVDFTATRSGYPSITKRFTIVKNKQGVTGQNATTYWLVTPPTIQKSKTGAYTPSSITVSAMSQTGSSAPAAYSGRFIISESNDGTTYTDKYTSSSDESSKTYTPSAGIKTLRVRLYLAGGTSTLVDEQIIPIVSDGVDSVYATVWTPNGNIVRNNQGNITAKCDLYDGGTSVSATTYKWYVQDPTATTSSGGDTDGGNGWRLLQSIADPSTAPTLAQQAGGTLTGATYYVKYTWVSTNGETKPSPESSLAVTANNTLKITVPAFPTGVTKAKVYVGTASGQNRYQADITTSGGTLNISAPINTTNPLPPATNTATYDGGGVTGFTTATITIPASAIPSVQSFKCVAIYNSKTYSDVCTVVDVSDPIMVTIVGVNTFKNGQGQVTLTAKLYQAGVEIDPAGTTYTYTWYLYDSNNAQITTWNGTGSKTGKTITVDATDINVRGNIVCQVSQ
jgi:hypothetical protein